MRTDDERKVDKEKDKDRKKDIRSKITEKNMKLPK